VVFAGLALLLIPELILNGDSVMILWLSGWLILTIALPGVPFIFANKKLKALKSLNGWYGESTGVALVDMKLAAAPKKTISVWWFVPTIVISIIPVIHTLVTLRGRDEFWPLLSVYLSFFVMTAVFYFLYRVIFRQKAEVVDENTSMNAALTQIRRYNWGKSWILIAWLTAVFDISFWLLGFNPAAVIVLTVAYSAVLLVFVMLAEFKTRKMQQKLTSESGRAVYTDDDDWWLFGMFYNNPNDSHIMINSRTGMGMTMNLARAPGKLMIVFTALLLLCMPAVGLWMMHAESTPVSLTLNGTQLAAAHTGTVYTLDIGDITSAELLDKLPTGGVRTNGTAFETVLKGNWRFDGIGSCRLCLNPRVPPFLVVKTAEHAYILGSNDAEETRAVYQALAGRGLREKAS
jgi:uncharacterized membrane protein